MTILQAVTLGLIQGVTEFLPISSSGFLILVPELFGWDVQSVAFDAFLHIATLAAVIAALWQEVKSMTMALVLPSEGGKAVEWRKLAVWIALATIPAVLVGAGLEFAEIEFRSAAVVAWSFIVWGTVLYLVDRRATNQKDELKQVGTTRAWWIGCAQAIALIPGTSRSGITVTAGLASGLSRETATRFSFLLAIPTIAAAGFLKLGSVVSGTEVIEAVPLLVGFLVALLSAFFTIKVLLSFLKRYTFAELAIFRVIVGIAILIIL